MLMIMIIILFAFILFGKYTGKEESI